MQDCLDGFYKNETGTIKYCDKVTGYNLISTSFMDPTFSFPDGWIIN